MGQAESQPEEPRTNSRTGVAFHVLRVAERSPAAGAGVDPFFDFICGVNGEPLDEEIGALTNVLEQSEGRRISLQVWSTKRREVRDIELVPSRTWSSGSSSKEPQSQPSLLGLSLRLCDPQHALQQVWHILEILEGSPAQSAGLVPFGDWVVGYAGGVLRGEGDFYDIVESHVDKPLRLFVYNADYDVTREVVLVPNRSWGGEGLLGCGVGYGLLHRIPRPQDRKYLPEGKGNFETPSRAETETEEDYPDSQQQEQESQHEERQSIDFAPPPRNGTRNSYDGDGYNDVPYELEHDGYTASEGVEVVPVQETFGDFDPTKSRTTTTRKDQNPDPFSPKRASSSMANSYVLKEEEEHSMV